MGVFSISTIQGESISSLVQRPGKGRPTVQFEKSGFSMERASSYSAQEAARFIRENKDILSVIDRSDEAKKVLEKKEVSSRQDLVDVLAETAKSLLQVDAAAQFDLKTLQSSPLLSSLITLNVGGFRDLVNKSSDTVALFSDAAEPQNDSYKRLGKMAADLFKSGSPLNDEGFFRANPKAASYLLNNSDAVLTFTDRTNGDKDAQKFKDRVDNGAYKSLLEDFVSGFAATAANSGVYTKSFFSSNIPFAEFVAAGESLRDAPTPAEFLKKHPEYQEKNPGTGDHFNFPGFVKDVTAFQARNFLDSNSPASEEDLRSLPGLGSLIVLNKGLRQSFNTPEAKTQLSFLGGGSEVPGISSATSDLVQNRFHAAFENPQKIVSIVV